MKDVSACSNFPHIIGFNYKDFSEEFSKHKISWDFEVFWLLTNIWNSPFKWNFCHNWVSISPSCSIWQIFDGEQYCVQRHLGRVTQFLRHGSFRLRFISWEIDTSHHAPLSRNIWTWTAYFFAIRILSYLQSGCIGSNNIYISKTFTTVIVVWVLITYNLMFPHSICF